MYTFLKHKQPLGFLCGLLGVLIALPACGVLHRQKANPAPCLGALRPSLARHTNVQLYPPYVLLHHTVVGVCDLSKD